MATTVIKSWSSDNQADVNSAHELLVSDPTSHTLLQEIVNNTAGGGGGSSAGFSNLSPGYPKQVAVGVISSEILPANSLRKYAHIFNNSNTTMWIQFEIAAIIDQGIRINPGNFFTLSGGDLWLGSVNAISNSNLNSDILEGIQ